MGAQSPKARDVTLFRMLFFTDVIVKIGVTGLFNRKLQESSKLSKMPEKSRDV